jgi:hypothetical protein
MLSDADKKSILQHAVKRAENDQVTAHNVDFTSDADEEESVVETDNSGAEAGEIDVNIATTDAKKQAHPGDLRRMMSTKGKGGKKKNLPPKEGTVTMAVFSNPGDTRSNTLDQDVDRIDDILRAYWDSDVDHGDKEEDF